MTANAAAQNQIAVLGWGSLLWDNREQFSSFTKELGAWQDDGPELPLEFSRVSGSRDGALTLVIDHVNGRSCRVSYALSKRKQLDDAVADLRCREGTVLRNIGRLLFTNPVAKDEPAETATIRKWAIGKKLAAVVWTALESNFTDELRKPFTIENAVAHLQALEPRIKASAAEYIWRAPAFVVTPLRTALEVAPWFSAIGEEKSKPERPQ